MLLKSALLLISNTLPCPFPLQMELLCEHQQIRVLLDGRQLCDFTHRIQPLSLVKALRISGDIKLTKVAWKKETMISQEDRWKCTFSRLRHVLSFSSGWFRRVGIISFSFTDAFEINTFRPPYTLIAISELWLAWINLKAFAEIHFWPSKLQDLWCYAVSHILMALYPLRHARWQSSVLSGGWLLLALWLEPGIMQVVGLRKEKQEIFS